MLTFSDEFRFWAKDLEFKISPNLSRWTAPLFGIKNPYCNRDIELNSLFFHIPKTAGTSLRSAIWREKAYHIPASRYFGFDPKKFQWYFKFCIVRNPWARVYSAYNYLYGKAGSKYEYRDHRWAAKYLLETVSFKDFIIRMDDKKYSSNIKKYIHFRDQLDWIAYRGNSQSKNCKIDVDYIGRYENLDESFEVICSHLGVVENLPALRVGSSDDYRTAYNTQMVDIVRQLYRRDIEYLNYSFE